MMNDDNSQKRDLRRVLQCRADVERLANTGHSTHEIAHALNLSPRVVGRNLREIHNRYARALAKKVARQPAVALERYEGIYCEAMGGWRRSQQPKTVTTTELKKDEGQTKETVRSAEGPGDNPFLNTALRALKGMDAVTALVLKARLILDDTGGSAGELNIRELLAMSQEEFEQALTTAKAEANEARENFWRAMKNVWTALDAQELRKCRKSLLAFTQFTKPNYRGTGTTRPWRKCLTAWHRAIAAG